MPNVIQIQDQEVLASPSVYKYATWPKIEKFNPVQSRLLDIYEGTGNVGLAAATSAGKTVSAEMFMAYEVRQRKGKTVYIGPMKSLTNQKLRDWTDGSHHFADLKVSICTGDYRMTSARVKELDAADVILMTPEMLASRCRNHKSEKSNFLKEIGTIVFDESHLLTVPSRGDHIEVALMKITEINPGIRVVLLSATMPNVSEICGWVCNLTGRDTHYLDSKYRPCPLGIHYETYYDGDKKYDDKEVEKVGTAVGIVNYYSDDKFLVFVHTKRTGQKMIEALKRQGIDSEFHNADLSLDKRLLIETKFEKDPKFRVIVATSTLAWGLNLPARRVIVVGVDMGLQRVENYNIRQMVGRSGRVGLDPRGDAYILVPESKAKEVIASLKKVEPIKSTLLEDVGGHYKTLAFHVVSEIHHGNVKTKDGFHHWFRRSLAYHQNLGFGDVAIDKVIDLLVKCKAITVEPGRLVGMPDEYKATPTGIVASMFYYSPFDVADLKQNFSHLFDRKREGDDYFLSIALGNIDSHKFGIVNKIEKGEMSAYQAKIESMFGSGNVLESAIKVGFAYFNMLNGHENPVFGALQAGLRYDMDRTLQVLDAVDSMASKWERHDFFRSMKMRLTYGVRPELVELCQIPNVGKARAEKLYKAKIRTLDDFLAQDENTLSLIMNLNDAKTKESIAGAKTVKLKEML